METDSFFYRLFNDLPQTLFELIGLPATGARDYRFDSVELKKAFRIDGLFLPKRRDLPVYFTEVQFQRRPTFYANLFAKVFSYLEENDPKQDWCAVPIFPTRREESGNLTPYEDLLASKRVKRIYLEDVATAVNPPVGIGLLQLLFATQAEAETLAPKVVRKAAADFSGRDLQAKVVELVEKALMTRFPDLNVEETRMKFHLHDIRKSKAWQQMRQEGIDERHRELIQKWTAKGMSEKEMAELLGLSVAEIRKLANGHSR